MRRPGAAAKGTVSVAASPEAARLALVGVATAAFCALARRARRGTVTSGEERAFRMLNGLPRGLFVPVWVVMQAGNLGAVGVAVLAARSRSRPTAAGMGIAGVSVWAGAKLLKRMVRRGRPAQHLACVSVRGAHPTGLGFPSGHAAVAITLAVVSGPLLRGGGRRLAWATALVVGAARQYVGAHLPLDVVGGTSLGIAAGNLTNLVLDRSAPVRVATTRHSSDAPRPPLPAW